MKKIFKRGMSGLLAVLMAFTVLVGFGTTTAFAASETAESYMISFPRDGDAAQIYSEDAWGHSAKNYMNGWATGSSNYTTLHCMDSFDGKVCYCIEPGLSRNVGDTYHGFGEDFWDNYPSQYNNTIEPDDIKLLLGRIIRGSVQLTKVDKDYPDHHLSGAVFEVYRGGKLVGQMEELSDGVYKLDDLPYGDYTLKETEAPKGFFLDEKTYSFSIKEDGKTVVVENEAGKGFVNQAQTGGIRIEKTSDDGVLKGFTFRVEGTDITGNAFSKDFVTDEKGQIHIDGLRIGDYVISEVPNKANEKYELPANVTVTVHEGKTVVAKFHNKLKPVTDIPKTGDTTNMPLWAALAGISAIGAGAAAFFTFRKKKEVGKHER